MTEREMTIWWRIIPANLAAVMASLILIVTIPFGLWRGLQTWQFLSVLISANVVAWLATFFYIARNDRS